MLNKKENGFEYIEVKNSIASAKIALQGAHIFEYKCSNKADILWLSPTSHFELGKAIRGGIPICWPRFVECSIRVCQHMAFQELRSLSLYLKKS